MIKPPVLQKGDTIALVAPSGGLAALFPHRLDVAKKFLESEGFIVKEYPTTRGFLNGSAGTPEDRARDLTDAFVDPSVKAIICTIGGLSSNELLPLLDFEVIKKNPTIFCGYSDITVLHRAIQKKTGLITFYGLAAMTQLGENPEPLKFTWENFKKAVMSTQPLLDIPVSHQWTDELLDWSQKKDLERARNLQQNTGWEWLRGGKASGVIVGGCLPSILRIAGTEYDSEYDGTILFIETPEGQDFSKGEPLVYVDSDIMHLRTMGVFDVIKGLIVGRPFGYTQEEHKEFKSLILKHTEKYTFPVLYGVDVGHSDPQLTIPLGVKVTLDSDTNKFSIDEAGTTQK